ncbi:MAG: glycosyltransferase family 4 protein [Nitrospirae bacterium]|nr:glycosyltransferase family 4 protein [Candidatus Manganitrophaceae bacterium]
MSKKGIPEKATLLLIGPTPPPYHGVGMAMQAILDSSIATQFRLVHLDITDRRGIGHVDQPDLYDVFLFVKQFFRNGMLIVRERPALFYIPISQTRIGFIRDSLFILPALMMRSRVIVHLHGANFESLADQGGFLWKRYLDFILRRVARFIVLGEMLRPIFGRWAAPDRISVVPNGVIQEKAEMSERRLSAQRPFRILFLSTLCRQKGLFVLLDAIPLIVREEKDVGFEIAGPWASEDVRREAERRLTENGMTDRVRFVGQITGEEKRRFLRSGDLFIFPGVQQEGQPLTVLEAMSEGLPVVATDRGCLRETVAEGVTGFIVPPNSAEAIAEKVIHLIRHPGRRDQLAINAAKRVKESYTVEQFVFRLEEVFGQTLIASGRQNRGGVRLESTP